MWWGVEGGEEEGKEGRGKARVDASADDGTADVSGSTRRRGAAGATVLLMFRYVSRASRRHESGRQGQEQSRRETGQTRQG